MKEFGEGSRDIIISTTGWDINPRALGIVPKEAKIGTLKGFHWVSDAFFMVVPKGVSDDKLAVLLDLMAFLLKPESQAFAYDEGYLYPGPAVKNVPLSMAPKESQDIIREFGRPEYAELIADNPIELPLTPDKMVVAFRRWDEEIGSKRPRQGSREEARAAFQNRWDDETIRPRQAGSFARQTEAAPAGEPFRLTEFFDFAGTSLRINPLEQGWCPGEDWTFWPNLPAKSRTYLARSEALCITTVYHCRGPAEMG